MGLSRSSRALFYEVTLHLDPGQLAFEPLDLLTLGVLQKPLSSFQFDVAPSPSDSACRGGCVGGRDHRNLNRLGFELTPRSWTVNPADQAVFLSR